MTKEKEEGKRADKEQVLGGGDAEMAPMIAMISESYTGFLSRAMAVGVERLASQVLCEVSRCCT